MFLEDRNKGVKMGLTSLDYQRALDAQTACNASGLIHSLHETIDRIWEEARMNGQGTEWVNTHPILRLYAEQLSFLSSKTQYFRAYEICEMRAKEHQIKEGSQRET
jgi:hypothetical protein